MLQEKTMIRIIIMKHWKRNSTNLTWCVIISKHAEKLLWILQSYLRHHTTLEGKPSFPQVYLWQSVLSIMPLRGTWKQGRIKSKHDKSAPDQWWWCLFIRQKPTDKSKFVYLSSMQYLKVFVPSPFHLPIMKWFSLPEIAEW